MRKLPSKKDDFSLRVNVTSRASPIFPPAQNVRNLVCFKLVRCPAALNRWRCSKASFQDVQFESSPKTGSGSQNHSECSQTDRLLKSEQPWVRLQSQRVNRPLGLRRATMVLLWSGFMPVGYEICFSPQRPALDGNEFHSDRRFDGFLQRVTSIVGPFSTVPSMVRISVRYLPSGSKRVEVPSDESSKSWSTGSESLPSLS